MNFLDILPALVLAVVGPILGLGGAALLSKLQRRKPEPMSPEVADKLINAIPLLLVIPLAEELAFRGFLNELVGVWIGSAVFALWHLGNWWTYPWSVRVWGLIVIFGLGMLCSYVYAQWGLAAAYVVHTVWNAIPLVLGARAARRSLDRLALYRDFMRDYYWSYEDTRIHAYEKHFGYAQDMNLSLCGRSGPLGVSELPAPHPNYEANCWMCLKQVELKFEAEFPRDGAPLHREKQ